MKCRSRERLLHLLTNRRPTLSCFFLINFIICMILKIFIILQAYAFHCYLWKGKQQKAEEKFFFILIFLPSLLTTLSCDCYTFCGCNFVGLVTPKTMAEVQSLERLPMTLIPGPPPKSKTNEQMQQQQKHKLLLKWKWAHGYWKVMAKQRSRLAIKTIAHLSLP